MKVVFDTNIFVFALIEPSSRVTLLSDERGNRVLDCAVAGAAGLVVTGDREMLSLGRIEDTRIVSLRELPPDLSSSAPRPPARTAPPPAI